MDGVASHRLQMYAKTLSLETFWGDQAFTVCPQKVEFFDEEFLMSAVPSLLSSEEPQGAWITLCEMEPDESVKFGAWFPSRE